MANYVLVKMAFFFNKNDKSAKLCCHEEGNFLNTNYHKKVHFVMLKNLRSYF